jgi:CRISPR/Cas system CSM-associated protein Csm2 small subunit
MKLAFLYFIQIIGQIVTTGSQKVPNYHVLRNNKDNIQVRDLYKKILQRTKESNKWGKKTLFPQSNNNIFKQGQRSMENYKIKKTLETLSYMTQQLR